MFQRRTCIPLAIKQVFIAKQNGDLAKTKSLSNAHQVLYGFQYRKDAHAQSSVFIVEYRIIHSVVSQQFPIQQILLTNLFHFTWQSFVISTRILFR